MGEDTSHLFNSVLEAGASRDLDCTGRAAWSHFMAFLLFPAFSVVQGMLQ